jgi:hypothetical protein
MSSEGNATASIVTLHVVPSLDGFIARKDNTVSWLDVNGSVYEAGFHFGGRSREFRKAIRQFIITGLSLGLHTWVLAAITSTSTDTRHFQLQPS